MLSKCDFVMIKCNMLHNWLKFTCDILMMKDQWNEMFFYIFKNWSTVEKKSKMTKIQMILLMLYWNDETNVLNLNDKSKHWLRQHKFAIVFCFDLSFLYNIILSCDTNWIICRNMKIIAFDNMCISSTQ